MSTVLKVRGTLLATLAALALALVTPTIDHASAKPSTGGSKVTCAGGGEPGDVITRNTYTYVNGKVVSQTTSSSICGNDGKWHLVAQIRTPRSASIVTTTKVIRIA